MRQLTETQSKQDVAALCQLCNKKKLVAIRGKNWHHTQNLLSEGKWEFKSPRPHQINQSLAFQVDFAGWTWVENGWKTLFDARSNLPFGPHDRRHAAVRQLVSSSMSSCYIGPLSTPI